MEATLLGRHSAFEHDGKVYINTPVVLTTPSEQQVEEFAFSSAVKSSAPNDNIGWLQGRYVEAERGNLNGAMWLTDELAMKSATPMLMPITVMHDPRTAVGTIADCKFLSEAASARLENVLAVWKHRFPSVWEEAEANIAKGQLMQSMECYTPWYTCSTCEQAFVKLPHGAEQASWCDHLRTKSSRRILRDVCFTGTGLIFGSRGGVGAYTEAHLDHFHDEIAEYHERAHQDSTYRPRSATQMGTVNIEESELATLRQERNDARAEVDRLKNVERDLSNKVEKAEADKTSAETAKAAAEQKATQLEEQAQATQLRDKRMGQLGQGFIAKLGEFSRERLTELAGKVSDDEWDSALKEREELAQVKRDAQADGSAAPAGGAGSGSSAASSAESGFKSEEVASFMQSGVANGAGNGNGQTQDAATSVRQLARRMTPRPAAGAKS